MRILLTGATGLVGAHAAAALHREGHALQVLLRRPERLAAVLAPLGVAEGAIACARGDVTDRHAVEAAVAGCDAVLHAAGLYSADVRQEALMQAVNVEGTRNVLACAVAAGCSRVIHVSSYLALFPPRAAVQRADDPVTSPRSAYARTKAEAERIARALQAEGAPVTTLYPGAIHGPEDPTFGASPAYIAESIRTLRMLVNPGGRGYIDVRDLAALIARAVSEPDAPRRIMCGGRHVPDAEVHGILCRLTGRPIAALRIPGAVLRTMGRLGDLWRVLSGRTPQLTYEAACVITRSVPCDDAAALALLGHDYLPIEDSLRDLLVWMRRAGHLSAEEAGAAICAAA